MSRNNRRTRFARKVSIRDVRERILIVCEGEKTEPNYFLAFRIVSCVLDVRGTGHNTLSLVRYAVKARNQSEEPFDQVWCVFDRDSFSPANFNSALALAKEEDIKVAYSNEAFELWYLLHFSFLQSGLSRKQYGALLTKHLGRKYVKNDQEIFRLIHHNHGFAIENAKKLLLFHGSCKPCNANPSTTVHLLVKELLDQEER